MSPDEWLAAAHSDLAIACHKTIVADPKSGLGEWDHPRMRQCQGAAIFRANVCKLSRDPEVITGSVDHKRVFSWDNEFKDHHEGIYNEFYKRSSHD